ncbi:tyrosine/serine protein phosphatase [Aspergillus eucalypticola CBS 122712]|uniref:Tyrosine/serine protein phosphatase n=1 Tax=Aspergillus eucalypticola (strain CBS 122712 / IBT 29274) TaxID=1448314 RepID=A0A317UM99_ASPEC|nr:tyrosine/serine protein phosphatase [Aspergillus eucalypticola CBS 122712]PWY62529.1 tyrosine/serine protein phosphatase [Aspergillus eucalypticola CBS 122712]
MSSSHPRQSSVDLDSPGRPFDNIINFRDVGRTINQLIGKRVLKEGILFRSARLDDASERDKRRLVDEFHISTVVDLRSSTEHQIATNKRLAELAAAAAASTESSTSSSSSTSSTESPERQTSTPPAPAPAPVPEPTASATSTDIHLPDLPTVTRFPVSLTGKAFERTLLWRLDWWNFFKVLALVASGYRPAAVQIVGQQVMSPRGLVGLGMDTLDSSYGEMKTLFDLFSSVTSTSTSTSPADGSDENENKDSSSAYPILIHCTQGKDRTGLIILLLLLLVADVVPEEVMREDYLRSEGELVIEMEERMKEVRLLGLSEDYTKCPRHFVETIRAHLEERYGGVQGYLGTVGVGREQIERIREVLLA